MPERFWNACCEIGVDKYLEKPIDKWPDWDVRIKVSKRVAFKKEVEEVLRRVLGASMVIDPAHRAGAQVIASMMPEAWETMETIGDDDETISDDDETISDDNETISDDEEPIIDNEETIQPPSNDGPSESGVAMLGERE